MRVLYVIRALDWGGVERTALDLVEALPELHLAVLDSGGDLPADASRLHRPRPTPLERWAAGPGPLRAFVRYWRYSLRLLWLLLTLRPDVLVTASLEAMIAGVFVPKPGVRWVGSVGSDNYEVLRREHPRWWRLYRALLGLVYRRPRHVLVPTHGLARVMARQFGVRRLHVIPNPVHLERVRAAARQPAPADVVLAVGRLIEVKGFDLLLRAWATVGDRLRDKRLVIRGDGPWRRRLQDLARELGVPLELPGFTPNPWAEMRHAHVVVIPSRAEGFSNVLVEALAAGAAVVAFDCGHGPREIVRDGVDGRLVPCGDVHALGQALLTPPATRDHARERARDFDLPRVAGQYRAFLEGLLSRP